MDKIINETKSFLRNMFSSKPAEITSSTEETLNPDNRRQGETYEQWGKRICGIVTGSLTALPPYLHKVYNSIYNEQANNIELQRIARANIEAEIGRKNEDVRVIEGKLTDSDKDIEQINKKIEDLKAEQVEIKNGREQVNKEQRLKLIIGLFILIPLTIYLFLFYSSTFYSAFFRDPSSLTGVGNAMFDSRALPNAYTAGMTELGFVLSAPIIFLGLGFALHFFSVQKGKMKYLKMAAILLVTVMFDCILAYKIGEQLHTFGVMTGVHPIGEEYTVSMAFQDINTWAVIFCGFIVYVIWGIVFDMSMSAYDKMDLNKTQLERIKQEIEVQDEKLRDEKTNQQNLKQQKANVKNKINELMAKLGSQVYIDYAAIRTEMNNFFSGWITMMQVLTIDKTTQDQASNIYNNEVALLIQHNN